MNLRETENDTDSITLPPDLTNTQRKVCYLYIVIYEYVFWSISGFEFPFLNQSSFVMNKK